MATVEEILARPCPERIWTAPWPEIEPGAEVYPSPGSWLTQCIYQIVVDRFSDGREGDRHILRRDARPQRPSTWNWKGWADSGRFNFQGGTIRGAMSKLDYLRDLGVTAVWLSPVWKQFSQQWIERKNDGDPYHGYAVQNFLDVDRRFGTRKDLVDFVAAAHGRDIRVIVDVVINHTAPNWLYAREKERDKPPYLPNGQYCFGAWLDGTGREMAPGALPGGPDDAIRPCELQYADAYQRAGFAKDFGNGDPEVEQRTDMHNRDLLLESFTEGHRVLDTMIRIWSYWLRLARFDGMRVDTFKHVEKEEARLFCSALHEVADEMGKHNFLIAGEIGGNRGLEERYLEELGRDLDAALETGWPRVEMRAIAQGGWHRADDPVSGFFDRYREWEDRPYRTTAGAPVGSHRRLGTGFICSVGDHDGILIEPRLRLGVEPPDPQRCVVGVGLLILTLGIPCLYYGDEQAMTGPEPDQRIYLGWEGWGYGDFADRYLREAMFGPEHPRKRGRAGIPPEGTDPADHALFDPAEPGFAAFGAPGQHLFDQDSPSYRKVRHLLAVRAAEPALQLGRQYLRPLRVGPNRFENPGLGQVLPWSRILAGREVLCVINPSASETRSAAVRVCGFINAAGATFTVLANSAVIDGPQQHEPGDQLIVSSDANGFCYLDLAGLAPASVLVLGN